MDVVGSTEWIGKPPRHAPLYYVVLGLNVVLSVHHSIIFMSCRWEFEGAGGVSD